MIKSRVRTARIGLSADRGFSGKHDRVDALVDGGRGVAHLGAGRPRLLAHGFEDLCRDDHRPSHDSRPPRDVFLDARHALERHLEPKIPARDHHTIGDRENLIDPLNRSRPLDLRDDGRRRACVVERATGVGDVRFASARS